MGLERINQFKKALNMTNEELSEKSKVPKSTIDKITSGRTLNPNLETVKAIVYALGKTLEDLDDRVHPISTKNASLSPDALRIGGAYDKAPQEIQAIVNTALDPYIEAEAPKNIPATGNNVELSEEITPEVLAEAEAYGELAKQQYIGEKTKTSRASSVKESGAV